MLSFRDTGHALQFISRCLHCPPSSFLGQDDFSGNTVLPSELEAKLVLQRLSKSSVRSRDRLVTFTAQLQPSPQTGHSHVFLWPLRPEDRLRRSPPLSPSKLPSMNSLPVLKRGGVEKRISVEERIATAERGTSNPRKKDYLLFLGSLWSPPSHPPGLVRPDWPPLFRRRVPSRIGPLAPGPACARAECPASSLPSTASPGSPRYLVLL